MNESYIRELELIAQLKRCAAEGLKADAATLEAEIALLKIGKTQEEIDAMLRKTPGTHDEAFEVAFGIRPRR